MTEYVVVSKKAIENGHIGFGYRTAAADAGDSGWRLMYDRNESKLDIVNPDKVFACKTRKFLKHFPEMKEILKNKKWSIIEEINGEYTVTHDKKLESIENYMTGKNFYNGFAGAVVTADPKNMHQFRKLEPWETLLPPERL